MMRSLASGVKGVKHLHRRLVYVGAVVVLTAIGLGGRLYYLQIVRGDEFATLGRANFIKRVEIPHTRGMVLDRKLDVMVDNRPTLNLEVTPHFLGSTDEATATLRQVADILGWSDLERDEITKDIISKRGLRRFRPILVHRDLSPTAVEEIENQRGIFRLDGVELRSGQRRQYMFGDRAAHVLGYVNEIDPRSLERAKLRGNQLDYQSRDLIGRAGIEHQHERHLRGADGSEKVVVDAKGRRNTGAYMAGLLGDEKRHDATPGNDVILTLDADLQATAERAFNNPEAGTSARAGALVALDPNTGAVLALVSLPGYDPNAVGDAMRPEYKSELDQNPLKPWVNRTISGQYAPGSTFKIVTALAALSTGTFSPQDEVFCPGYYRLGRRAWRCHKDSGHGAVNLKEALKVSCDTYFYAAADKMGIEPIADMARRLGIGDRSGVALRGEKPGLAPDKAFHDRVEKKTGGYQRGMALNTSIGQGAVLATPLQLALAYGAVLNGGRLMRPRLTREVREADHRVVTWRLKPTTTDPTTSGGGNEIISEYSGEPPQITVDYPPETTKTIGVAPEHLQAVREGLLAVAQERGGTAYWRRSKLVSMGGKTGTAPVVRLGTRRLKSNEMEYFERDHAWFVGYAPADAPEIVVAVVNEHSGHGGSQAEPIAVQVIDAFFSIKQARGKSARDWRDRSR